MRQLVVAVALALLVGCTGGGSGAGQSLLGVPGLGGAIRTFYERYAWEREGLCVMPTMTAISQAEVVERSGDLTHVAVRYSWRSGSRGDAGRHATCQGFEQRDFLVRMAGTQPVVVAMTGGQRGRR